MSTPPWLGVALLVLTQSCRAGDMGGGPRRLPSQKNRRLPLCLMPYALPGYCDVCEVLEWAVKLGWPHTPAKLRNPHATLMKGIT